jgi:ribosomal protein L19E
MGREKDRFIECTWVNKIKNLRSLFEAITNQRILKDQTFNKFYGTWC